MREELVWACKNGDLDQVKAIVGKPVRILCCLYRISLVLCYGVCVSAVQVRVVSHENSSLVNSQFENKSIGRKNELLKDRKIVISDYSFDPSRASAKQTKEIKW